MAKQKLTQSGMMLEGTTPLTQAQAHKKEVNSLTPQDLHLMLRRLNTLRTFFDGGECVQRINDCIEVVQGLADMWQRESYRFNSDAHRRNKVRELKPVKRAPGERQLTQEEEEAAFNLSGQSLEWMVE